MGSHRSFKDAKRTSVNNSVFVKKPDSICDLPDNSSRDGRWKDLPRIDVFDVGGKVRPRELSDDALMFAIGSRMNEMVENADYALLPDFFGAIPQPQENFELVTGIVRISGPFRCICG